MGIDAGIKKAFAALNLKGELVYGWCKKNARAEEMLEEIRKIGVPVLIAADTCPPPHFVKKMAAMLNVKLLYPKESMKREEKKELGKRIKNEHIRDSYAAAIKAYRKYANRLRQIEKMGREDREELKRMVIEGRRIGEVVKKC